MNQLTTVSPNGQGGVGAHAGDGTLPNSLESEQSTLGAILLEESAAAKASQILAPDGSDFYRENHRTIWGAVQALRDADKPVDVGTVGQALRDAGTLDFIGGAHYLGVLIEACPTSAHVGAYAETVREKAQQRRALVAAQKAQDAALRGDGQAWQKAIEAQRLLALGTAQKKRLVRPDEMAARPPVPQVIERLLPARALGNLYGASRSLKSFLALDMSLHIATGRAWHGRDVQHGPVVYVACEAADTYRDRIQAWSNFYGVPLGELSNFCLIEEPVHVHKPEAVADLLATVRAELGQLPVLFVFDTLTRALAGGEENAAKDAALLTEGAERLARETGASVLFVHHTGKNGEMRGSSGFFANFDYILRADRVGQVVSLLREKTRGAGEGEQLAFAARVVEVGKAPDHTSLVLVPTDLRPVEKELPADAQIALTALQKAQDGMTAKEWRQAWDAASEAAGLRLEAKEDAKDKAFNRARKKLLDEKKVLSPNRGYYLIPALPDEAQEEGEGT